MKTLALCLLALAACSSNTTAPPPDFAIPPCTSNADCMTSKLGHVCSSGTCVVCAGDADCPSGKKCDAMSACVDCLGPGDCGTGKECIAKTCTTGCDDKNPCPTGQVCNNATHGCVQCNMDNDCSGGTPHCAPNNICVGCVTDDHCGAGMVCHSAGCVSGCSGAHPVCPNGEVCAVQSGACVGCISDGDCKNSGTPRCDVTSNTCVTCLPANDNCPSGQYCVVESCMAGCKGDNDCMGATPRCSLGTHTCVACVDDTSCALGQICMSQKCVAGCDGNHACQAGLGCCAGGCISVLSDAKNCGACGNACPSGNGCCGGACVPFNTTTNCGACGNACPDIANGSRACTANACAVGGCNGSFLDCDKKIDNGCEVNGASDAMNCGACGAACGPTVTNGTAQCASGVCNLTCSTGFKDCNSKASDGCEINVLTDVKNCGTCGNACMTGVMCNNGLCGGATSCGAIIKANPSATDGVYTLDPLMNGSTFKTLCDMTDDGGGWTLALRVATEDADNWSYTNTNWTSAAGIGTDPTNLHADYKSPATWLISFNKVLVKSYKNGSQEAWKSYTSPGNGYANLLSPLGGSCATLGTSVVAFGGTPHSTDPVLGGSGLYANCTNVENNADNFRLAGFPGNTTYWGGDAVAGLGLCGDSCSNWVGDARPRAGQWYCNNASNQYYGMDNKCYPGMAALPSGDFIGNYTWDVYVK